MKENLRKYLAYRRLLLRRAFRDFNFRRDMWLGLLFTAANFLVRWRLKIEGWPDHLTLLIVSYVLPLLIFILGDALFRLFLAPWWVHLDSEKKQSEMQIQISDLISKLSFSNQRLEAVQSEPTGPEIMLTAGVRDELVVSNEDGGVAFNIVVGSFRIGRATSEEHKIPALAVNGQVRYSPRVPLIDPFKFSAFFAIGNHGESVEVTVPLEVTFSDGANKQFVAEFEMSLTPPTLLPTIVRKSKRLIGPKK
jgi:hypothetical protein